MPVENPLQVVRGRAPDGCWELVFCRPQAPLRPFVSDHCGYFERAFAPKRRRELPGAQVVLIIDFGPTLRLLDREGTRVVARHDGGFLAGLDDSFTLTESTGVMEGIQVNFTPIGARRFLGVPMKELARRVVPLEDVLGPTGKQLAARLHDLGDWPRRFAHLDNLLLDRFARAHQPPAWLEPAWDRIVRSGGNLSLAQLSRDLGYSRKHLAVTFTEQLGFAPKAVANLVRFERALQALKTPSPPPLAQLALDLGYYDQAHFSRAFRQIAGISPLELVRAQRPHELGLAG